MVTAGGGAIVNVASTDAFVHDAPFVHYSVSKAGLVMMTRAFAFELGHLGVRCNAVAPGATLTPMTADALAAAGGQDAEALHEGLRRIPLRRFARPEEQAAVVLFLASEEASYVNGATLLADGGMLQGYWYAPHREPPDRLRLPPGGPRRSPHRGPAAFVSGTASRPRPCRRRSPPLPASPR